MNLPVVLRRQARLEYDEAADWYESRRPGLGAKMKTAQAILTDVALAATGMPSPLVKRIMGVAEESVSKSQTIAETGKIEELRDETERQELAARMAESQARVAQELAIARRIE